MATKLKPCPCCGDEAFIYGNDEDPTNAVSTQWNVECCKCGMGTGYHEDRSDAIKAWNTRVEATP